MQEDARNWGRTRHSVEAAGNAAPDRLGPGEILAGCLGLNGIGATLEGKAGHPWQGQARGLYYSLDTRPWAATEHPGRMMLKRREAL